MAVDPGAIRRARAESGLTLAQVAAGKVSRAAIHLIETGKARPSLETLHLIAAKTKKPISYFMAPAGGSRLGRGIHDLESALARNDLSRAVELGTEMLEKVVDETTEASVRYLIGRARVRMGDGRSALSQLEKAGEIFNKLGDEWKSVECLDQIACAYFLLDDPRSLPLAEEALRRCQELEPLPEDLASRILGNLAIMHAHARRWPQAIHFYEECLKAGAAVLELRHRALTYDGLSLAYQRLGNFGEASTWAHKAIALYTLASDAAAIAQAENNLGDILLRGGHLEDAERHVRTGLKICDDYGLQQRAHSYGLLTLGEIHLMQHAADTREILNDALRVAESEDQLVAAACAHQLLGRLAGRDGNQDEAVGEFELATVRLENLKMPERLRDCLIEYATYLESAGESASQIWKRAALAGAELARPQRPFGTYLVESEASSG